MSNFTKTQDRALWLAYFIIGAALPLLGWKLWGSRQGRARHQEIDESLDSTVEDSFPASDPPASW